MAIEISSPGADEAALRVALSRYGNRSSIKTTSYAVLAADSGLHFNTIGAAGAVTFSLPAAVVDMAYGFMVGAAQNVIIDATGTEVIHAAGLASSAGGNFSSSTQYSFIGIECHETGHWVVTSQVGPWTAA